MTNPNHTAGNLSADNAINLQQLLADHGGEIPGTALPELYQKSFGAPLYPKGTKLKVALQSWPLSDVCEIDLRPCLNGPPLMAVLSKNSSPKPKPSAPGKQQVPNAAVSPTGKHKTKMCHHWENGWCRKGRHCDFAHGEHELQVARPKPRPSAPGKENAKPWARRPAGGVGGDNLFPPLSTTSADTSAGEAVAVAAQLGWTQVVTASDAVAPVCVAVAPPSPPSPPQFKIAELFGVSSETIVWICGLGDLVERDAWMGDKAHKCMIAPILFEDMPNAMKGEVHDAMVHLEKNSSMADFLLRGTDIRAYAPGVAQNSVHSLGTIFEAMFHHAADQHAVVVQYMDWVNTHCSKASPPAQAPPAPPAPGSNPWHCAVCSKTCNSQTQWNEHVNSDKHKSAMSAFAVVTPLPMMTSKQPAQAAGVTPHTWKDVAVNRAGHPLPPAMNDEASFPPLVAKAPRSPAPEPLAEKKPTLQSAWVELLARLQCKRATLALTAAHQAKLDQDKELEEMVRDWQLDWQRSQEENDFRAYQTPGGIDGFLSSGTKVATGGEPTTISSWLASLWQ